jgi:hypothetical protein
MRLNPYLVAVITGVFAVTAEAFNEPYAGAIIHQDKTVSPKADFHPGNMTDIMPLRQT